MNDREHSVPSGDTSPPNANIYSALILIGMLAPAVTFMVAVSNLSAESKLVGLASTALVYFAVCFWSFRRLRGSATNPPPASASVEDVLDAKLTAFAEATRFFGTALQPADTVRLIFNRLHDLLEFDSIVLFTVETDRSGLAAIGAQGRNGDQLASTRIEKGRGLAGLAVLSAETESTADLSVEKLLFPDGTLTGLLSSVAVPLVFESELFAVLQIFSRSRSIIDDSSIHILESAAARVGPLLRSSLANDRSLAQALTDPLTNLPNERAFFMILENQLAECARSRDERPLAIATLDIKGFDDESDTSGEDAAKLFNFVGDTIGRQLRKMDFLARSVADEFLIVLPTATEAVTNDIVKRIAKAFAVTPFQSAAGEETKLWLNVGTACFWKDGETANQLLQTARLRRQQAKAESTDKVVWFPKEYVH